MAARTQVIHKEVVPPCGVTHAVAAHLTSTAHADAVPDLVVVRSRLLEVYRPRTAKGGGISSTRVELVYSKQLWGVVESLAVQASPSKRRDALLLSFRDAKLAVLAWDTARSTIVTTSLHYYEGDAALKGGRRLFPVAPKVVTDPRGRAAAMLMFRHQLAVLPAVEANVLDMLIQEDEQPVVFANTIHNGTTTTTKDATTTPAGHTKTLQEDNVAAVGNSYVINVAKQQIRDVRDLIFLHGYTEPTLLLLHESDPTWVARYPHRKDTNCLTALSLNLLSKAHPRLWSAHGLPSDAHKLVAVPLGGALVVCLNHILYYKQGGSIPLATCSLAFPSPPAPPLMVDPSAHNASKVAAAYAQQHATDVPPDYVSEVSNRCAPPPTGINTPAKALHLAWLTDSVAAVALQNGSLVTLQLVGDAGNVRSIQLTPSGTAPPPTCLVALRPTMLFLGSYVADSILVHAVKETGGPSGGPSGPPPSGAPAVGDKRKAEGGPGGGDEGEGDKRQRLDGIGNDQHVDVDAEEEEEELRLYGTTIKDTQHQIDTTTNAHYTYRLLDSLPGCTPLRTMVHADLAAPAGAPPAVVAAVGRGRSGALAVLRPGVLLDVVSDVELPGVQGVWAVRHIPAAQAGAGDAPPAGAPPVRTLVVLSRQGATQVLDASGDELQVIQEQQQLGIPLTQPTVFVGGIAHGAVLLHVGQHDVRLLNGLTCVQQLSLTPLLTSSNYTPPDASVAIAAATATTYHATLHLTTGVVVVLKCVYDGEVGGWQLQVVREAVTLLGLDSGYHGDHHHDQGQRVTAVCVAEDTCGWLITQLHACGVVLPAVQAGGQAPADHVDTPRAFIVICRQSGVVQVYDAHTLKCCVVFEGLGDGRGMIHGRDGDAADGHAGATAGGVSHGAGASGVYATDASVVEVKMHAFGPLNTSSPTPPTMEQPSLFVLLSDGWLYVYKMVCVEVAPDHNRLALLRQPVGWLGHLPAVIGVGVVENGQGEKHEGGMEEGGVADGITREGSQAQGTNGNTAAGVDHNMALALGQQPLEHQPTSRIVRVDQLGNGPVFQGILITGPRPLLLAAARGTLRPHTLLSEGHVVAATPFTSPLCPHGMITCTADGHVRTVMIPPRQRLDTPWPMIRIALKCTPLAVGWYPEGRLVAVLTQREAPFRPWVPEESQGDAHASYAYATAEGGARARNKLLLSEVRLLTPGTWSTAWRAPLDAGEVGMCVSGVHLKNTVTGATHPLLAVGTALTAGEDYPSIGRVLLFEITSAVDGSNKWAVRLLCSREVRNPVTMAVSAPPTAASQLDGLLVVAAGTKLEVHSWNGKQLVRNAFFDAPMCLTSLNVLKNYILVGDVHKGLTFVMYKAANKELVALSKDFDNSDSLSSDFIINESVLLCFEADAGGTLRTFQYNPQAPLSYGGKRLLPQGVFHIGARAMSTLRHPLACSDGAMRQGVLYCSPQGSMGVVVPTWDKHACAALERLQLVMALKLPHAAGLNPPAFRYRYTKLARGLHGGQQHSGPLPRDGFLDGDLLMQFGNLSRSLQRELAKEAGTDAQLVLGHLRDVLLSLGG